jgi:hypothetical protein
MWVHNEQLSPELGCACDKRRHCPEAIYVCTVRKNGVLRSYKKLQDMQLIESHMLYVAHFVFFGEMSGFEPGTPSEIVRKF